MRTKSISIERNFHISNEDPYARAKYILDADLEDGDNIDECYTIVADTIDAAFRNRYPHMRHDLNFDTPTPKPGFSYSNEPVQQRQIEPLPVMPVVKENADEILKSSLSEMMDCTTPEQLEAWKIWAKANNAEKTYKAKLEELSK